MTYQEIKNMIESFGYPFTYYEWKEGDVIPNLPYVVFYFPSSDNMSADNVVHQNIERMNIEVYSKEKDFAIEQHVETILNHNGFYWEKYEAFIESEDMYQVMYQMEVVITR